MAKQRLVCYPSDQKIKERFAAFVKKHRMTESQAIEYAVIAFMDYETNPINQILGATGSQFWEKMMGQQLKRFEKNGQRTTDTPRSD